MKIKYNRVSTQGQTGTRFEADSEKYDFVLLDKVSEAISFKDSPRDASCVSLYRRARLMKLL